MRTLTLALIGFAASMAGIQEEYPKLSPFSGLRWSGDTPEVEVAGGWYELVSIEGKAAKDIVAFCKKTWPDRWRQRFGEDLVEAMTRMGKPPGDRVDLQARELDTGKVRELKSVAMTKENRNAIWLSLAKIEEDLDQVRAHLEDRYSYLALRDWDWKQALAEIKRRLKDKPTRATLAIELFRFLARFGDGHSSLEEDPLPRGYAPYLVGDAGGRLFAFHPSRGYFLDRDHPYLRSIDGLPVDKWLAAAGNVVSAGSPAFVRNQGVRMLRNLAFLRGELGRKADGPVRVELESEDRARTKTVDLPLAPRRPAYGTWPRGPHRELMGDLGYLRIDDMSDHPGFLKELREKLEQFRGTQGLIIDVRGNGGGTRDALRTVFPYFMKKEDGLHVANVAAYRLPPDEAPSKEEGYLQDRELHPITSKVWSTEDRAALEKFAKSFKPEWAPAADKFSAWHYFALKRGDAAGVFSYDKPVVILMDAECFSATDIFLSAFKGWRNVTLMGAASGGGSGRARKLRLRNSGIEVKLSTIASFRADGSLYDGRGMAPDVEIQPKATDFLIGKGDSVLEAAIERLKK